MFTKIAIVASHPIQYQAPIFRELARRCELDVFYAHRTTPEQQAKAGFGVEFAWDTDLVSGFSAQFMRNVSNDPGPSHFKGCDTPEITELLAEGRFDAVLVMGWHLKSFIQTILAAKRQRLPLMVRGDSHLGMQPNAIKRGLKAMLYPAALRLFDCALYVGQRNRVYFEHYHYPTKRLVFAPHCVDTDWFSARAVRDARMMLRRECGLAPEAPVALFVGKLLPFKRPLDVVQAAAIARQKGCPIEVMVAGAGPLAAEMNELARQLDVPLHDFGFCNQSRLPAVYAAGGMLVLPSTGRETWGLVANEALACGLPLILSDQVGSAADLVDHDAIGRIFPVGDLEALATAMMDMAIQPLDAETIARKSAQYSVAACCDGIVAGAELAMSR